MQDFRHPSEFITFLMIGAQKAGTTWIDEVLRRHPDIFLPEKKEVHFFDFPENLAKGVQYYSSHFEGMATESHAGECTPDYLWTVGTEFEQSHPHDVFGTAKRTYNVLPDIRLVVSLRNPVDRAISAFHHHRARGRFPLDKGPKDVWYEWGIVSSGWYARQLEEWYQYYDPSRFLILFFEEDIKPDGIKRATIDRICRHIGTTPLPDSVNLDFRANDRLNPAMAYLNKVPLLRDRYRGQILAQQIDKMLPPQIQSMLEYEVKASDIEFLQEEFQPHNAALEALLGRKLPW